MWQVFILFYFLFGAASYLFRRVLAQRLAEYNRLINACFFVLFLLPAAIILSLFFPHNLNVGLFNLLLLLGGSIVWPLLNITSFRANKEVDVGIFAIISNLSPVFALAIALPFLDEKLQTIQLVGIGLLILSGVIAASSKLKKHNRMSREGIFFCVLSAVILGVAVAYERFMLDRIDFGAYLIYGWGAQVLWSVVLAGKQLRKIPELMQKDRKTRQTLLAWGATNVIKSVAFIGALKASSAAIISAASDFMSVAVVVAAYFFLRERQQMFHKWVAAIIGILGLLMLTK